MGISEGLPKTGYIKMIDIWTIFALSYPFSVIALYTALEVYIIHTSRSESFNSSVSPLDTEGKAKLSF